VHKFECGIGRMKLTCKYQYFSYVIFKQFSFFSFLFEFHWSSNAKNDPSLSDYPLIQRIYDLESIIKTLYEKNGFQNLARSKNNFVRPSK